MLAAAEADANTEYSGHEDEDVEHADADGAATVTEDADAQPLLPLARVRKIMKYDDEVTNVREEAVVAVARAAELFLEYLVEETYREASRQARHAVKRLTYADLSRTVREIEALHFLADIVPERRRVRDILSFVQAPAKVREEDGMEA